MTTDAPVPPPDTKNWTFVIEQVCTECGFDPAGVDVRRGLGDRITAAAAVLADAATAPGGTARPEPMVWSPLEYAAHARDVCSVFARRVDLMQAHDGVEFENWDQDAAALEGRYPHLDPATVAADLATGAAGVAARFGAVSEAGWAHRGLRSNGSAFTTETLAVYFLHDLKHHAHDVRG